MKNTLMMIALLTATSAAMAATSYRENISPNAPKHQDSTQSTISQPQQADEHADMIKQIIERRSSH